MPRQRSAATTGQQCKAIAQSRFYLLNAKCRSAGCGELDGERYAIEVATDCRNCLQVVGT
jgi:hypothetical protein